MADAISLSKDVAKFRGAPAPGKVKSLGSYGRTAKGVILTILTTYGPEAVDYIYSKLSATTGKQISSPDDVEKQVSNAAVYEAFAKAAAERGIPPSGTLPDEIVNANPRIMKNFPILQAISDDVANRIGAWDKNDDGLVAGVNLGAQTRLDVMALIEIGKAMRNQFGSLKNARLAQTAFLTLRSTDWDDLEALSTQVPGLR